MEQSEPAGGAPLERHVRPDDEACECRECDGQGSYDQWKAVAGHYEGGETFRMECEACDGSGFEGPNARLSGHQRPAL